MGDIVACAIKVIDWHLMEEHASVGVYARNIIRAFFYKGFQQKLSIRNCLNQNQFWPNIYLILYP